MKYRIAIDDSDYEVELLSRSGSEITFKVGENTYNSSLVPVFPEHQTSNSEGSSASTPAASAHRASQPSAKSRAVQDGSLRAPMPGVVVSINVEVGKKVEAGEPLFVIEAMKMENVIASPQSGVVEEIFAHVGDQVENSQVILKFGSQ